MMSGILLACSRATYACILIAIIIYVILQKDKTDKIKTIGVSISILIFAILYSKIFLEYYQTKNCIVIIGALIILALLTSFFNYLVNRSYKILKKYWIIFTILLLILAWMSFKILTIEAPLELFKKKNEIVTERIYEITNLKNEKAYLLEFDVNSKAKDDLEIYRIQVIERNVKGAVTAIHEESFGTINGKKIIAFMRKEDTDYIEMIFRSINVTKQQGLTINHLTINGKTYKLNYKYINPKVINRIKSFDIDILKTQGRAVIYKDAIELLKMNHWTGIGANVWVEALNTKLEKEAGTTEIHSYPLQLFLEFGIVSIVAYIIICIILLIKLVKSEQADYGIIVAIAIILLHSIIDFDLSFMNMMVYTYVLIATLSLKSTKQ